MFINLKAGFAPLDFVPVAKRYVRRMESENYDWVKAKSEFISFANHILNACQMAAIDENKYELDGILCGCFQKMRCILWQML